MVVPYFPFSPIRTTPPPLIDDEEAEDEIPELLVRHPRKKQVITEDDFMYLAKGYMDKHARPGHRLFSSQFGVTFVLCALVWEALGSPMDVNPLHLLWMFHYLKCYPSIVCGASAAGVSHTKYHRIVFDLIKRLAALTLVSTVTMKGRYLDN